MHSFSLRAATNCTNVTVSAQKVSLSTTISSTFCCVDAAYERPYSREQCKQINLASKDYKKSETQAHSIAGERRHYFAEARLSSFVVCAKRAYLRATSSKLCAATRFSQIVIDSNSSRFFRLRRPRLLCIVCVQDIASTYVILTYKLGYLLYSAFKQMTVDTLPNFKSRYCYE